MLHLVAPALASGFDKMALEEEHLRLAERHVRDAAHQAERVAKCDQRASAIPPERRQFDGRIEAEPRRRAPGWNVCREAGINPSSGGVEYAPAKRSNGRKRPNAQKLIR
jgi:hypothetical protein